MVQQVLPVLMLMDDVLLPHVSLIHIGVIIHSCLRHPHNAMVHYCWQLLANKTLIWTLQIPDISSPLHNNNLGRLLVAKWYIGGRLHDMFQGLGWFSVCKISEIMATACAAATDYPCSRSPSVQHWLLVTTAAAAAVQMHDHFLVLHSSTN